MTINHSVCARHSSRRCTELAFLSEDADAVTGKILDKPCDTTWSKNDKIGIFAYVGDNLGPYINLEYTTTDGSATFTGTDIYFYKPMILTAYYPFAGTEGSAPGVDGGWLLEANTLA